MSASLVGSEMCIRDSLCARACLCARVVGFWPAVHRPRFKIPRGSLARVGLGGPVGVGRIEGCDLGALAQAQLQDAGVLGLLALRSRG
eukprot:3618155-Alexandrium_andersonii.AAC.1